MLKNYEPINEECELLSFGYNNYSFHPLRITTTFTAPINKKRHRSTHGQAWSMFVGKSRIDVKTHLLYTLEWIKQR